MEPANKRGRDVVRVAWQGHVDSPASGVKNLRKAALTPKESMPQGMNQGGTAL